MVYGTLDPSTSPKQYVAIIEQTAGENCFISPEFTLQFLTK